MNRICISLVIAIPVLLLPALTPAAGTAPKKPNVLFIPVDDLRCELGCYGNTAIKAPNIDRLAASGVTFTRAYCQQAVCNPSRASLLTGMRPDSIRVWDLVTPLRETVPDVVTLPQYFMQQGYFSVGMGKIYHNTFPDPQSWSITEPKPTGYATYSKATLAVLERRNAELKREGKTEKQIANGYRGPATEMEDVPDNQRFDGALCDIALEHMRQVSRRKEPFFLAVGFIRPHLPWTPPKKYWDLYDPAKLSLAPNQFLPKNAPPMAMWGMYELRAYVDFADTKESPVLLTEEQQRRLKHGYYASVSFTDAQVGRLLDELERLGLNDNTIVVLWGDHGWKLGEHASWCKQTNYEMDTRAPLIVRWPGAKGNGKQTRALVEFEDIYPTLCDLAGLPVPKNLEGRSFKALLDDPTGKIKEAAFSQFLRFERNFGKDYMGYAMRTDRYRYVEWRDRKTGLTEAFELYDHQNDPDENENIAVRPENKALLEQLGAQLQRSMPKRAQAQASSGAEALPRSADFKPDANSMQALQGYAVLPGFPVVSADSFEADDMN